MRFYYGADKDLRNPAFGLGNPSNDYGLGFYMTQDYDSAILWASRYENGYVITYDYDDSDLNILNLDKYDKETVLKWITILVTHRYDINKLNQDIKTIKWLQDNFKIDLDYYDMIIGYRADDSYFNYSSAFVEDNLSFELLIKTMKLEKLGLQYVPISPKAFKRIKFVKSERVSRSNDYEKFRNKILQEYKQLIQEDSIKNTFIRDIMREYEK